MKKILFSLFITAFVCSISAQAYPDRHSTSYTDAWVSCQVSPSPNSVDPSGHWILYDLGQLYPLGQFTLWNYNDPKNLDRGVNQYEIAISTDATSWTSAGIYNLNVSDGSAFYEGEAGPHLGDVLARYVLITAISNHGGACYGMSEVRISVDGIALPVELVDFNLECNNNAVRLSWVSASEVNNSYFEIQRSENGTDWVALGKINGNGNSNSEQTYTFEDKHPINHGFYRLRQEDLDGKEYFHDIKSISCGSPSLDLMINPNPAMDHTNISLTGFEEGIIQYSISDVSGKIWMVSERAYTTGETVPINLSELPFGPYILTVKQGDTMLQKQLIKVGEK